MNVPVDCRFSSIVADFSYTLYSRVFFTPKESILDVKPHPMSTMNVPFDRRFSSIAADFSVSLYSRVFFTPYESTRDVKPRTMSIMKVPFGCRFSSIVADFSVSLYSREVFIPYESTRDVKPRPKQMYQENMKRREVSPEFGRRRPFEDPVPLRRIVLRLRFSLSEDANLVPPLSTSCSPVTISIMERSENFGQISANVSGEHEAKGGIPWISSSKAYRRPCASTSNSSPP